MSRVTRYLPGGEVRRLALPDDRSMGAVVRRASHIEPAQRLRRMAFHALRALFREEGRVAEWTRGWRCRWRVDLRPSGGPVAGSFLFRDNALAFEHAWITKHWIMENADG